MPKTSSKASSPSWRTLRRQAEATLNPVEAKKLRVRSNLLRRAERAKAKTAAKAGPKKRIPKTDPITGRNYGGYGNAPKKRIRKAKVAAAELKLKKALNQTMFGDQNTTMRGAQGGPVAQTQGWSPAPTHDELLAQNRAEEISKLARSRGGAKEQIAMRLACWNRIAEVEARKEAEVSNIEIVRRHQEQAAINVVSGFIAQINGMAKANNGPLPRSVVVSGYTLARVIDALTKAGYTEDGFKSDGIRRLDREAVVNDMVASRTRR